MWIGQRNREYLRPTGSIQQLMAHAESYLGEDGYLKYRMLLESLHGNRAHAVSTGRKSSFVILTSHLMRTPELFDDYLNLPKVHQERLRTTFGYLNSDTARAYFRLLKSAGQPFPEILQSNEENVDEITDSVRSCSMVHYGVTIMSLF